MPFLQLLSQSGRRKCSLSVDKIYAFVPLASLVCETVVQQGQALPRSGSINTLCHHDSNDEHQAIEPNYKLRFELAAYKLALTQGPENFGEAWSTIRNVFRKELINAPVPSVPLPSEKPQRVHLLEKLLEPMTERGIQTFNRSWLTCWRWPGEQRFTLPPRDPKRSYLLFDADPLSPDTKFDLLRALWGERWWPPEAWNLAHRRGFLVDDSDSDVSDGNDAVAMEDTSKRDASTWADEDRKLYLRLVDDQTEYATPSLQTCGVSPAQGGSSTLIGSRRRPQQYDGVFAYDRR